MSIFRSLIPTQKSIFLKIPDVCQKSDNECYPKGTTGLDDNQDDDNTEDPTVPVVNPPVNPPVNPAKPKTGCKDKNAPGRSSDCPFRTALCDNNIYRDLMTQVRIFC